MSSVTTTKDLKALIAELEGAQYLALDTEFMRDQTYWPKLCLLQVAAPGIEAIIDPLGEDIDLAPFYKLLKSPKIVKVLHASRQDIEIFYTQGGIIPEPLFDTQIAAMVAGFGDSASYETLARRLAHAEIDKSARFTDWSRRPLSKRQLEYALAEWREREAQTRDLPRNRVIKDEALMEIAAHPPADAAGLDHIRAVPKGFSGSRLGKGRGHRAAVSCR